MLLQNYNALRIISTTDFTVKVWDDEEHNYIEVL